MKNFTFYLPKLKSRVRVYCYAGVAKPSPKLGQALGPLGINMMQFCKEFNEKTQDIRPDVPMRVKLYAFQDRSFKFLVKPPPTSWFLKKAAGLDKCTPLPGHMVAGEVGIKYIYEIAKIKQQIDPHLWFVELDSICKVGDKVTQMVMAQCKSMGLDVVEDTDEPDLVELKLKI